MRAAASGTGPPASGLPGSAGVAPAPRAPGTCAAAHTSTAHASTHQISSRPASWAATTAHSSTSHRPSWSPTCGHTHKRPSALVLQDPRRVPRLMTAQVKTEVGPHCPCGLAPSCGPARGDAMGRQRPARGPHRTESSASVLSRLKHAVAAAPSGAATLVAESEPGRASVRHIPAAAPAAPRAPRSMVFQPFRNRNPSGNP